MTATVKFFAVLDSLPTEGRFDMAAADRPALDYQITVRPAADLNAKSSVHSTGYASRKQARAKIDATPSLYFVKNFREAKDIVAWQTAAVETWLHAEAIVKWLKAAAAFEAKKAA